MSISPPRSKSAWGTCAGLIVICALAVHRIIFFMFDRAFGERHPFLRALIRQSKGPLALALVAFALAAALQSAPFPEAVSAPVGRLLLIAFIVLAGWIAHIAVETGWTHLPQSLYRRDRRQSAGAQAHHPGAHSQARAPHLDRGGDT